MSCTDIWIDVLLIVLVKTVVLESILQINLDYGCLGLLKTGIKHWIKSLHFELGCSRFKVSLRIVLFTVLFFGQAGPPYNDMTVQDRVIVTMEIMDSSVWYLTPTRKFGDIFLILNGNWTSQIPRMLRTYWSGSDFSFICVASLNLILLSFFAHNSSFFSPQACDRRRLANQGVTWRVSASPHFSRGKTNTEKREGEEKEESESHLLLAAVPAARFSLAVVLFPGYLFFCCFDKSVPIFIPNVRSNCCLKKREKRHSSFTFHHWFPRFFLFLFLHLTTFFPFPAAVSSRSFHSLFIGSVRTW